MNFFIPLHSPQADEPIVTVLVSGETLDEAEVKAIDFYRAQVVAYTGFIPADVEVKAGHAVPAPANAYVVMLNEDRSIELVAGYTPVITRYRHDDWAAELQPQSVVSVHLDESSSSHVTPRPYTLQYAGEERRADTPIFTVSDRTIVRMLASLKGVQGVAR